MTRIIIKSKLQGGEVEGSSYHESGPRSCCCFYREREREALHLVIWLSGHRCKLEEEEEESSDDVDSNIEAWTGDVMMQ